MSKRVAAAVLCAVLNFFGPSDLDDAEIADDASDPVEITLGRSGGTDTGPLAVASAVSGDNIECAWVAERERHAVAAATVARSSGDHSFITLSAANTDGSWQSLLEHSLQYCRQCGVLKVSIESAGASPLDVRNLAEQHGFQFSRLYRVGDMERAEFYADLYHRTDET